MFFFRQLELYTRLFRTVSDKTSMRVGRSWMLATEEREWSARARARVDPHVNCFIPRRLDARRIHEEERALTTPTTVERNVGEPSGLRARYDRGSRQTLYYFASRDTLFIPSSSPCDQCAVRLKPFLPKEQQSYRTEPDPTTICFLVVLNPKEARWIFDVNSRRRYTRARLEYPLIICKLM